MVATTLYCPRLIGREGELAALAALARRAAGGETVFAFVGGDAGAGKTRLIEELRLHLPRGMRGVLGTCMEYAPSPMGSLLDIVAALDAERGVPVAAMQVADPTGDDPVDKRRLFERVTAALRAAASTRPFTMIIDDAHCADSVTLDLLQFLTGTLRDARVLIVVAYRTGELSTEHPLHVLVARATRARNVRHIELGPLRPAHIRELIDATIPPGLRLPRETLHEVRDRSEGNPLFAEEFLKTVADGVLLGEIRTTLPASLRGLLLDRLRRIQPADLRLLEIAALIGRRFSAAFLARIAGTDADALTRFLRMAIDEHFLVEDRDDPNGFVFRHALTRDTILSGVLALQARALHLAIAQEIEREPAGDAHVVELAEHYWRAAAFTECAGYAQRAGDLAKARHAYVEAADFYERALACGIADEPTLVGLHEKAASAYASLGAAQKVLEHLDVAVDHYVAVGDSEKLVGCYLEQAPAYRRTAQTERAFAVLRDAAQLSSAIGNEKLRFKSAVQLAQLHAIAEEWRDAEAHLSEAEALVELADPRDEVRFCTARAALHLFRHDLDPWRADCERAVSIARAHGDPTVLAYALTGFGMGARKVGQLALALSAAREAVEGSRSDGTLYTVTFARLLGVNMLYLMGELGAARTEMIDVLADVHEPVTIRILIAQCGVPLSIALRDDALFHRSYSPEVLEAAFSTGVPIQYAPLAAVIAEHHLAAGDEGAAAALLERMLASLPEDWNDCESLLPVAVCCSRAVVERARTLFEKPSNRTMNVFVNACRELFRAYAAARFGTREAKLRHANAAAVLLKRLGMPLMEAEAYDLAEQTARATAICETAGALRLPRRLGPPSRGRSVSRQLTAREREIVALALRSLSNSAIADELSLSERTVEAHIAAAYRKLGIRSRGELLKVMAKA